MEHVEYYEQLEDLFKAVEESSELSFNMQFTFYFDIDCDQWVLIYGEKEG